MPIEFGSAAAAAIIIVVVDVVAHAVFLCFIQSNTFVGEKAF